MGTGESELGSIHFTHRAGTLNVEPGQTATLDLQNKAPSGDVLGFSLEFSPEVPSEKDIIVRFDTARKPENKILRVHVTNLYGEKVQVEIWQMLKKH